MSDLHWLAGLLEGEGSFGLHRQASAPHSPGSPRIQLQMTDRDVVARAARLLGSRVYGPYADAPRGGYARKPQFKATVHGPKATAWMRRLYPHLGTRRRARVREILSARRAYERKTP